MMRAVWGCLSILVLLAVSACDAAQVTRTSPPPLTLGPGPTIVTKGSCRQTSDLEAWSQAAYYQTTEFIKTFDAAAVKGRSEVYDDVLHLQDIRTDMISRATPDCAFGAQSVLADAMTKALKALQSYSNGDLKDLRSQMPALDSQLQNAVALETALFNQLDARLPRAGTTPTPTSAGVPGGG